MNVFFGIEDCISFLNTWNVIAFTLCILTLRDALLLHNQIREGGGSNEWLNVLLECGMQCAVNLYSFQNCPVINLQLLQC
jgi:hypothetical protein